MLATRCLYLSSIRMSQPNICSRLATAPLRMQPAIIWQAKPLAIAYYSKDVKPEVLFSSSYSFMSSCHMQNYPYSTAENNNIAVNAIQNPLTTDVPLSTLDSSTVSAAKPTNPKTPAEKKSESKPLPSLSSVTASSKSPSTSPPKIESFQSFIDNCSAGQFKKPDIKLPSRDQVESFLFKSLVYFWDFTYYIVCMSLKLFDTYVIKNPTIQHYWKLLLKRMEQARKETTAK